MKYNYIPQKQYGDAADNFGNTVMGGVANAVAGGASTAVNGAIGGILGQIFANQNDKRQINQQQKLTNMQLAANKDMSAFNFGQQLDMWNKTNYEAQVQHLENAGLNPALLYAKGGPGGTTGAPSGGISGASAPAGGHEIMDITQMGLQNQMIQAQIKLTEAQAHKTEAETPNVGLQGQQIQAQTQNILQDTQNKQAQQIGQQIQNEILSLDQTLKTQTLDAQVSTIKNVANKTLQELNILKDQAIIADNTWQQNIDLVNAQLAGKLLENNYTGAKTDQTRQQILQVIQDMQVQIKTLANQGRALDQKDQDILIDQMRNKLIDKGIEWGAGAAVIGKAIDVIKPRY